MGHLSVDTVKVGIRRQIEHKPGDIGP